MEKNGGKKTTQIGIDLSGSEKYTLSHALWAFKMIADRFSSTVYPQNTVNISSRR